MYVGHFASALAMKAKEPRVPTWALLLGAGLLTPGVSPGFSLDFIDWSHSLAMSLVWALLFDALFLQRGIVVAAWCGFAVFSHFVLDLLMHPHDIALWPHSSAHLGLGIWTIHPPFWWFFELGVIVLSLAYYVARAKQIGTFGGRAWGVVGVILFLPVQFAVAGPDEVKRCVSPGRERRRETRGGTTNMQRHLLLHASEPLKRLGGQNNRPSRRIV